MEWLFVFLIFCAAVPLWPLLALVESFERKPPDIVKGFN